jgi:hypothetical protein
MSCAPSQHLPVTTGRVGLSQYDCAVEFYNPPVVWRGATSMWQFPPTPGPAVEPWPPWQPTYVPPTWSGSGGCGCGGSCGGSCGCSGGCGSSGTNALLACFAAVQQAQQAKKPVVTVEPQKPKVVVRPVPRRLPAKKAT